MRLRDAASFFDCSGGFRVSKVSVGFRVHDLGCRGLGLCLGFGGGGLGGFKHLWLGKN